MNTNITARQLMLILAALFFWAGALLAQTPPSINSQPGDTLATVGGGATLSVGVSGTGPFGYQWYFNGVPGGINGYISTVAGGGDGDGGAATNAGMGPSGVAVDAAGDLFIADYFNNRVRKVGTDGIITTVAGDGFVDASGVGGYSGDGGAATNAELNDPQGVAVDAGGNVFIVDNSNYRIRKVGTNGVITTVAGNGNYSYSGDNGMATNTGMSPASVAVDAAGNVFISDTGNQRVRRVGTNGIITTVAGTGRQGFSGDGGMATNAALSNPYGLAVDEVGNLFISDAGNSRIRKVGTNGVITTVAGNGSYDYTGDGGAATNASFNGPYGVAMDAVGNMFIADIGNNVIRKIGTSGIITTVAGNGFTDINGNGAYSGDGGAATNAELNGPQGVAVNAAGNLFIADTANSRVREVTTGGIIITVAGDGTWTYSGDGGAATGAQLHWPAGVVVDAANNLIIADFANNRVRKVRADGTIITVAGNGNSGYSGDGGAATNASLTPDGVAVDAAGNVFIADVYNEVIRRVRTDGIITTVAGNGFTDINGNGGYSGDGGAATNAELNSPEGVAVDASGNLFIADYLNNRIRKVGTNGIITTVAGNGSQGFSGDGGAATNAELNSPSGLAVDTAGNLFIADTSNFRIRKVGTNGIITTLAGTGTYAFSGDGGAATNAAMSNPTGVAVDAVGNIFIADLSNTRVRKVGTNGIITTVAGNGDYGYSGDGGAGTNAELYGPNAVAMDAAGDLLISDQYNGRIRKVVASNLGLASGGASLVLSSLTAGNAGNYYVIVTSAYGSVTSAVAALEFQPWFTGMAFSRGTVSMSFKGAASRSYVFSYATHLAPPVTWLPLTTNSTDANGNATVIDTNTVGVTSKFYRGQ